MSKRFLLPSCSLAALAMLSTPAAAAPDFPAPKAYVGLHAGPMMDLRPWDLGQGALPDGLRPEKGVNFHGGARLGYQLTPRFAFEGGLSYLPFSSTDDVSNTGLIYDVDILFHLTSRRFTPYALAGVGGYHVVSGDLASDWDPTGKLGLGLRGMLTNSVAVRLEARYVATDGFEAGGGNLEARVGLDWWPGAMGSDDADGDGIADDNDVCPQTPGVDSAQGCPDQDGDGIADSDDSCPTEPGPASNNGCPVEEAPADTDGDGVIDADDACVDVPGVAALAGCPDGDGDGIGDAEDVCPEEPGTPAALGCPDGDRDGVADKDDKCPEIRGLKDHEGCVPEEVKAFTGAIKGITFDSGKATIRPSSYATLDKAVEVMTQFPGLQLRVEGHTDDQGTDEDNQQLSQERADAVVAYLVDKGIAQDRLIAQGFGESKPVADNGTSAGRAKNRRIEFAIVEQ